MTLETDFIVVGSGIAGLRAALELAGTGARVTVLTKDRREESNTEYAQGGVAVALSEDDEASDTNGATGDVHPHECARLCTRIKREVQSYAFRRDVRTLKTSRLKA